MLFFAAIMTEVLYSKNKPMKCKFIILSSTNVFYATFILHLYSDYTLITPWFCLINDSLQLSIQTFTHYV